MSGTVVFAVVGFPKEFIFTPNDGLDIGDGR
jgi:hypothetical protein